MRRLSWWSLLVLICVLSQDRALGDEAAQGTSATDDQVQRAQATERPPGLPAPATTAVPRANTNTTTPGAIPPARPRAVATASAPAALTGPVSLPLGASGAFAPSAVATAGLTSLQSFGGGGVPLMLGDLSPLVVHAAAASHGNAVQVPWSRGYKMADNQSPRPQDRVFVAFNFFDDLSQPGGSALHQVKVYREFFGVEKTFLDGNASIGLRLPLNTISAQSSTPGGGGTSTALGDLTVFIKGIFWQDRATGSLLSGGLAVTTPNSPANFAGAQFAKSTPTTSVQPFLGAIVNRGDWFVQGFTGSNLPTDPQVATLYYNDIGAGYFIYRAADPDAFISAVVPTMEVHVNTPLSHRSHATFSGVPTVVDLTFGSSFGLGRWGVLSAGVVNPVTGPRPYELEAVVLLNVFFGQRQVPPTPPPVF
jgi:hypothetical protein